jgi:hypothetical protein
MRLGLGRQIDHDRSGFDLFGSRMWSGVCLRDRSQSSNEATGEQGGAAENHRG